ncbi:TfoX/Sxy family protein [Maribacter confluentis]|uniref:TfoX/Sxy family protein n=1 Tax=Maribacter confluentis TaxID=1656093 RepID=A0ABT8RS35_9FLAO|nr:TfoX/Sxy family protein [Maribacter confluentis]MDO1513660.1 TfoX/Sxy family protein [Maribacter confluentis]
MAYNEHLAERVRQRLKGKAVVEEKKMMGGLTFMCNGKMCLGVLIDKKSNEDRLMVRVGKLNYEELLQQSDSMPMDFTGKPLRGFLFITPNGFDMESHLDYWVIKALEFNVLLSEQ